MESMAQAGSTIGVKTGEIPRLQTILFEKISQLQSTITVLEEKLQTVLAQAVPVAQNDVAQEACETDLGTETQANINVLDVQVARLQCLIDRLGL